MKTTFCLLLPAFVLLSTFLTTVQVRFGVKAGLSLADYRGETDQSLQRLLDLTGETANKQMRTGFHAGAFVQLPQGERFSLESALLYSQKGTRLQGSLRMKNWIF